MIARELICSWQPLPLVPSAVFLKVRIYGTDPNVISFALKYKLVLRNCFVVRNILGQRLRHEAVYTYISSFYINNDSLCSRG